MAGRSAPAASGLGDDATLGRARRFVVAHYDDHDGVTCPCCGQLCKRYRRAVTSTMARSLIMIYRSFNRDPPESPWFSNGWMHVPTFFHANPDASRGMRGGDIVKPTYWGLLRAFVATREDGSGRNGFYKMTSTGRGFVTRDTEIRRHAVVYDGRVVGFEGGYVDIVDCLKHRFDYASLMAGDA